MRRPLLLLPALLALAVLVAHTVVNATTPYGFQRDEFLYLAMGRHLQLWRMDFPPFIAMAARATLAVLGGSLVAVRAAPAVVAALLVILSAIFARRIGGGALAQGIAALAAALTPLFMHSGNLFQPVIFDQLWWTLALLLLAGIAASRGKAAERQWLLLGLVVGVGLLTKFSIAFIGIGITIGVLAGPERIWFRTRWPWLALALALLIGCPSVIGQWQLGFPVAGQMHDLRAAQLERVTPAAFLAGQWEMLGPVILLAGAGWLHLARSPFRVVAWATLGTFVLLLALHGKAYYVGPIYPVLIAAGAVWLERSTGRLHQPWARDLSRAAVVAVIAVFGIVALPFGLPFLAPEAMARYGTRLGVTSATNTGEIIALPQDYADMLGWEDQVEATSRVYHSLSPAEQREAVILATNYGRAGANDHLGRRLGLPAAVSPVGSYWFFGPGRRPGKVMIVIGGTADDLRPYVDSLELAATVKGTWRVPEEREVTIWVARRPHHTLQEVWARFRGSN